MRSVSIGSEFRGTVPRVTLDIKVRVNKGQRLVVLDTTKRRERRKLAAGDDDDFNGMALLGPTASGVHRSVCQRTDAHRSAG